MNHPKKRSLLRPLILSIGIASLIHLNASAAVSYIGDAIIDGSGTDLSGLNGAILEDGVSPNNSLNGFGSGFAWAGGNVFYGLADRGPNKVAYSGGTAVDNTTSYPNRFQRFTLNFTPVGTPDVNGHFASYNVGAKNIGTTLLKNAQGTQYLGISTAFNADPTKNDRLDSEGIRVAPDGTVWISDEYGPYILHFNNNGQQIGSLQLPAGFVIPVPAATAGLEANNVNNTTGRVTNAGMEGLAISPDGKTLVGIMQSPLIQDGGKAGTNVRMVVYDLTNPTAAPKQYLYQLDSTSTANSEILAISSHSFLIDERDGVAGAAGIKKLYKVDFNQATPPTDLTSTAFSGTTATNGLPTTGTPAGVTPLAKSLFADIGGILNTASTNGASVFSNVNGTNGLPDKIEGYAWGPDLADGRHLLLASTDNDFVRPGNQPGPGFPEYIFAFAVDSSDVPEYQAQSFQSDVSQSINNIIVIYQENWPFDGLYGTFPGANGLANASTASTTQIDRVTGNPISTLGAANFINAALTTVSTNNPPPPLVTDSNGKPTDPNFPSNNPGSSPILNTLQPWALSSFINPTVLTGDIYHRYWQEMFQIAGVVPAPFDLKQNNSGFVTWSDNPGLVMSHFDATNLPEGLLAQQFTLCDNYFHSAFGGSFLNHQFLISAQAPVYTSMPTSNNGNIAYLDANGVFVMNTSGANAGMFVRDGSITPMVGDVIPGISLNGGAAQSITLTSANAEAFPGSPGTMFDKHYVVNTTRSANLAGNNETGVGLLPSQNDSIPTGDPRPYIPTIGDLLSQANVSWKWYSGGWTQILGYSASNPTPITSPDFATANASLQLQYHHQPFAYFDNYAPFGAGTVPSQYVGGFAGTGTGGLTFKQAGVKQKDNAAAHLQDETNFFTDVQNGTLPQVSFIKAVGVNNEHPGYAALQTGQAHVAALVQAVQQNPTLWAHTLIIVTYDEHGGRWDHVTPPPRDIWGPGQRVPAIVISPLALKGVVDHTQRETSSILATIEQRFGLPALNSLDANAPTFFNVLTPLNVIRGGFSLNRVTRGYSEVVTITNQSAQAVPGPIQFVLDNLSANTTLANPSGTTASSAPIGSPYITATTSSLAPGASISVTLQFTSPGTGTIGYTSRTLVGTTTP